MPAIGIDLITTDLRVAALRDGKIEIIPNHQGERVTPSMVAINYRKKQMEQKASKNAKDKTYRIKQVFRDLGIKRVFSKKTVKKDTNLWNFKATEDDNATENEAEIRKKEQTVPEKVSVEIFSYLKQCAEDYFKTEVKEAVVAVPASFDDAQRQAVIEAGENAGLDVLETINEPFAAVTAYGLQRDTTTEKHFLIFHLSRETFGVTIINLKDGKFEVIGGNSRLEGEGIANEMLKCFDESFKSKHECNIMTSPSSASRLLAEGDRVKKELFASTETSLELDALCDGIDIPGTGSRLESEDWNSHVFEQAIDMVEDTITKVGLTKNQIDEIVLVGESTEIPKIQELLEEYFTKNTLRTINPEEVVAYGAACQAAILNEQIGLNEMYDISLHNVTPLSLGIEFSISGEMVVVVPRNTRIPTKMRKNLTTLFDNQTTVAFPVYEGERPRAKDNHHIGTLELTNIPPRPREETSFSVCFDISRSGALKVAAIEETTKIESSIEISNTKRPSREDINKMTRFAEQLKRDEEYRKRTSLINNLEQRVHEAKKLSLEFANKRVISEAENQALLKKCSDTMEWIYNDKANSQMEAIQAKRDELEIAISGLMAKANNEEKGRNSETTTEN